MCRTPNDHSWRRSTSSFPYRCCRSGPLLERISCWSVQRSNRFVSASPFWRRLVSSCSQFSCCIERISSIGRCSSRSKSCGCMDGKWLWPALHRKACSLGLQFRWFLSHQLAQPWRQLLPELAQVAGFSFSWLFLLLYRSRLRFAESLRRLFSCRRSFLVCWPSSSEIWSSLELWVH